MSGIETVKRHVEVTKGELALCLDEQCKVRDNDTRSRSFLKVKIMIGRHFLYLDLENVTFLAKNLPDLIAKGNARLAQLDEEREAEIKTWREESEQRRNIGGRTRQRRKSGTHWKEDGE